MLSLYIVLAFDMLCGFNNDNQKVLHAIIIIRVHVSVCFVSVCYACRLMSDKTTNCQVIARSI